MTEQVVLTDEQIAGMTPSERAELMQRLARPADELFIGPKRLVRARQVRLWMMMTGAIVLLPWIVFLAVTLPADYEADHWTATWVGFDVVLATLMATTAVLGLLRRQVVVLTGFSTGVLLVCDAWFDVMTADSADRTVSILSAVLLELPIAAMLIVGALRLLRLAAMRAWRIDSGESLLSVRIGL